MLRDLVLFCGEFLCLFDDLNGCFLSIVLFCLVESLLTSCLVLVLRLLMLAVI